MDSDNAGILEKLVSFGMSEESSSELELLVAMYMHPEMMLKVGKNEGILHIKCQPYTADEEKDQFAYCNYEINVPFKLNMHPTFLIRNSRGLDDRQLTNMTDTATKLLNTHGEGTPMLFKTVENMRQILTDANQTIIEGECSICLGLLNEDSGSSHHTTNISNEATRGACYHPFHRDCMVEWLACTVMATEEKREEEAGLHVGEKEGEKGDVFCCPVCRTPLLDSDIPSLSTDVSNMVMVLKTQKHEAIGVKETKRSDRASNIPSKKEKKKVNGGGWRSVEIDCTKFVVVKHLTPMTNNRLLRHLFFPFDAISARVLYRNGRSVGVGLCEFRLSSQASQAVEAMNGAIVRERPIHCCIASKKELETLTNDYY